MALEITPECSDTLHVEGTCSYIHKIHEAGGEASTLFIDFLILFFFSLLVGWLVKKLTDCITANIPILIIPFLRLASV